MRITSILFAMVIFSGVLLGLTGFYTDLTASYGTANVTTNLNQTSMASNVKTLYNNSYAQMNSSEGGLGNPTWSTLGILIFKVPVYIGRTVLTSASTFMDAFSRLAYYVGLPDWALGLIFTTIGLVIIFAIIRFIWSQDY